MKLGDQRASGNVEDRRGIGMVGGGIGIGGIVIAVVAYFLGFDPGAVLSVVEQVSPQGETREAPKGAPADEMGQFVAKVLGGTENVYSLLVNRVRLQGFIVTDRMDLWPGAMRELAGHVAAGRIRYRETIAQGLESAPRAFLGMLRGENFGKQLVKVS